MNAIKATWKHGHIVPDEPVDWPEGSRLRVEPDHLLEMNGMTEEDQGDDPEAIERWIAEFDAIPPLQMTREEEDQWQAARRAQKEFEKGQFNQQADQLQGMWE